MLNFLARIRTQTLINSLYAAGMLCFFAMVLIAPKYKGSPSEDMLISMGFLFWALTGVVSVLRREAHVFLSIYVEGIPAVVVGLITAVLCIFIASAPIWKFFR